MSINEIFSGHYKRLQKERILKSTVSGAAIALGADAVLSALYWMLGIGAVWLGAAVGIPLGILSGVLLYRFAYRIDEKTVAERIDRLGLEERMITMVELKNDGSAIAALQREDAKRSLTTRDGRAIAYRLSRPLTVLAAVFLTLSILTTLLGTLASYEIIPYGKELVAGDPVGFSVLYEAEKGGRIVGESRQTVKTGEDTEAVLAVPEEGYIFAGWDDGDNYPLRRESGVNADRVIRAAFTPIDLADPEDEDSDAADDLPFGSVNEEGGGGDSDQTGGETPKDDGEGSGGGKWQDRNQFIDGATYYRDYLELYYQYSTGIIEGSTDLPPEIIEFFETYFSGI